jgi:hypothetical protein
MVLLILPVIPEWGQSGALISLSCMKVAGRTWTHRVYRKFSETKMQLGSLCQCSSIPDSRTGQSAISCNSFAMFLHTAGFTPTQLDIQTKGTLIFQSSSFSVMYLPVPLIYSLWPGANPLHLEMVK